MSRGVTASHGTLRRLGRLAFSLAICGCIIALPGVAGAGDGLLTYASFSGFEFGQPALSDRELSEQRGTSLEAEAPLLSDSGDDLAVILWDELKRNGNGGISATSSDNGVDSTLSSTITGQAY